MTISRRALLGGLGAASAGTLLWALGGCHAPARETAATAARGGAGGGEANARDVSDWLVDAVARIAVAFPAQAKSALALASSRTRTAAAIDVLGRGVARARHEAVVLRVQGPDGAWHEQVTSELSRDGIEAASRALVGDVDLAGTSLEFGPPAQLPPGLGPDDPRRLTDRDLLDRVDQMAGRGGALSSRIVYAANALEIDDTTLWAVAIGRRRASRIVRVRRTATRVAWNGTRPAVAELTRGWQGGVDAVAVDDKDLRAVAEDALALTTPGGLAEGDFAVELAPAVVASVVDAAVRALWTGAVAWRPEVARRLAEGAAVASPLLSLVDDPAAPGAYGGYAFDDTGADAVAVPLLVAGRVRGQLEARRRPGHVGPLEAAASHLRVAPGTGTRGRLVDRGLVLEGARACAIDPSTDRVVISAHLAAEVARGGERTGRVWPDVEIAGELGPLLAAVTAASTETATVALRDDADGTPRWRSIEAPSLASRARVRARGSAT